MSTIPRLLTVEELVQIPDEKCIHELRRGEVITRPFNDPDHGSVSATLAGELYDHLRPLELGYAMVGCGYLLEEHPDTLLGIDFSYISKQRLPQLARRCGYFIGPPELAIEIVSDWDDLEQLHLRVQEYIALGGLEAWVVNPRDHSITIYHQFEKTIELEQTDVVRNRKILPQFECLVSDLFGDFSLAECE